MSVSHVLRKALLTVAALGALALGGSALANAATSGGSSTSGSTAARQDHRSSNRPQRHDPNVPGGHRGANGKTEAALPAATAAKVKSAAEAKVTDGTVERVETDVDHGSPYEAHVRRADGTELEVLVDKEFKVTAVSTMQHP